MKCEVCGKGPAVEGVTVYRVNAKGVPGIWRCRDDMGASARIDPQVAALAATLAADPEAGRPAMSPELVAAVEKVLEGFEEGVFVRDTSRDSEPGWAIRLLPYINALGQLARARDAAAR